MTKTNAGRSVGQALVALLKDYGVDTIFGIPGVHNNELYRGLLNSGVHHVLPRHEQGAGFMADGYARATGRPGVCFHDHRAGADQHHDAAGTGLLGFGADAGDLKRHGR